MTSQKQTSLFTEDQLTSSREVSHVNPTQPQESDLERKTNAIYGLRCLEQFEKFNHVGLWAKTFSALLIGMEGWYSKRCKLTWKMKGTKYNRLYFQLYPSTHHTEETEFGLLPTPMAQDRATTIEQTMKRKEKYGGKTRGMYLQNFAVMGMLPTPTTRDYKGARTSEALEKTGRTETNSLPDFFHQNGKTSQLSPQFVMEMMGFPTNWTELPFLSGETNQSKQEETQ